jgi:50S ribosomal protein L16 3-hydroxylase
MRSVNAPTRTLLGGHSPPTFLRRHWQKEALLVRNAIAGFTGLFSAQELFSLASRDDSSYMPCWSGRCQ